MLGSVQAHSAHENLGPTDMSIRCPTTGQRYAAKALRKAIDKREPLVVLFGDSGSGKTALVNSVLGSTDTRKFAVLNFSATSGEFSSIPSFDNLLEAVCRRLGTAQPTKQRPETLAILSAAVNDLVKKGRTLLLAIDHADHLTVDVIAEVAQLAEYLDIPPNHLVRVFVGSMTLASRIDSVLRQLRVRVDQHLSEIRLSQPSADEVAALLAYEDSAQMGGPMLTSGAIDRISAYAKSNLHWAVPMADAARVLAESEGKREVTAELVRSALLEIWSPEQTLPVDVESPIGLSDSVSRSPNLDVPQNFDAQEEVAPGDARTMDAATVARTGFRRHVVERLTPILAISLFIIGTIALAMNDQRVDVAPRQPPPVVEEARKSAPLEPSATIAEEAIPAEQATLPESSSDVAPGGTPQSTGDSEGSGAGADRSVPDPSTESAAARANPEPELYGPWPESATGTHSNEPFTAGSEQASADPPQHAPSVEQPKRVKSPPNKKSLVLQPTEPRPDDLTSKHWIQKR